MFGYSKLISSEIAEDFTYYFAKSEQTPSAVALGVLVSKEGTAIKAGGYIIQPLPECDEDTINILENIAGSIKSVSYLMVDIEEKLDVAKMITGDEAIREIYSKVPLYECDCNKKRIDKVVISLGRDEALKSLENGALEVKCHFCNNVYSYKKEDVESLFLTK